MPLPHRRSRARRLVLAAAGTLLAAACGGDLASRAADEPPRDRHAAALLHAEPTPAPLPVVADLHVDTPTQALLRGISIADGPGLEASFAAAERGGVTLLVESLWIPRAAEADPAARLAALLDVLDRGLASAPGWALALSPSQARSLLARGTRVAVAAIEGATCLSAGPRDLESAFRRGVRMLGPTWTASNAYADSSAEPREPGGLTDAGRNLVRLANDLGVMIDVSHMSDAALDDTLATSRAPVLASHSNSRALCPHPRNLTDAQVRRIAEAGGLVAVMFHAPFVCGGAPPDVDDVAAHVAHLLEVAGPGHVAFGSDLDGRIQPARGLERLDGLPSLRDALRRRGIDGATLAGVMGESFLRYWDRVQAARAPTPRTSGSAPAP
ncbi:dipeptidase [Myxococcota bacterium]|nr:dipeptidase [Myxococcota bacterium]